MKRLIIIIILLVTLVTWFIVTTFARQMGGESTSNKIELREGVKSPESI